MNAPQLHPEEINRQFRAAMDAGMDGPSIWQMTEAQLVGEITRRCADRDIWWLHIDNVHHTRRRGSQEGNRIVGFPDLMLLGQRTIFRECKSMKASGLRPEQANWKHRLQAARSRTGRPGRPATWSPAGSTPSSIPWQAGHDQAPAAAPSPHVRAARLRRGIPADTPRREVLQRPVQVGRPRSGRKPPRSADTAPRKSRPRP